MVKKIAESQISEIVALYNGGYAITALAEKFNCSRSYMHKKLKAAGVKFRSKASKKQRSDGLRHCWKCNEDKALDEFGNNKAEIGGKARICKPCHNKLTRERKQEKRALTK